MGQTKSKPLLDDAESERLQVLTSFNAEQLETLYRRFHDLDKDDKGHLDAFDLLNVKEVALNPLGERIILAMSNEDPKYRQYGPEASLEQVQITFDSFVKTFDRCKQITSSKTLDVKYMRTLKAELVFRIFDVESRNEMDLVDVLTVLKLLFPNSNENLLIESGRQVLAELEDFASESVTLERFCDFAANSSALDTFFLSL